MRDYLFFLQAEDLKWVLLNRPTLLDDYHCVCFAPEIREYALRRGVKDVEYCESNLFSGDRGVQHTEYSEARALALDYELSTLREDIFGVPSAPGWDYLNYRCLFWRLTWFRMLAKYVMRNFESRRKIHILASAGPQDFQWPSGMAARAFGLELMRLGHPSVDYYEFDCRPSGDPPKTPRLLVPDFDALRERFAQCDAVVHVPTCFHDIRVFREKILRRWTNIVDVASPYWDVAVIEPVEERVGLRRYPMDHPARRVRSVAEYEAAYRSHAAHNLRDLLPAESLEEQVNHLACAASSQAVSFLGLLRISEEFRDRRTPLIISDHEAGLGGPLWTWAQLCDADVHVLPHSVALSIPLPACRSVTAYADRQFPYSAVSMDHNDVKTRYVSIRSAKGPTGEASTELRTIGILYSMFSYGDVQSESFWAFVDFYKSVAAIADGTGRRLRVRLKPDRPALLMCSAAMGIPVAELFERVREPLDRFALECDLGIMIGTPTTAAAAFVSNGIPLVCVMASDPRRRNLHHMDDLRSIPAGVPVLEQQELFRIVGSDRMDDAAWRAVRRHAVSVDDGAADDAALFN